MSMRQIVGQHVDLISWPVDAGQEITATAVQVVRGTTFLHLDMARWIYPKDYRSSNEYERNNKKVENMKINTHE